MRDVTYNIGGSVPPSAIDLEISILGTCMNDREAMLDAMDIIKTPEVFYKQSHQFIYAAFIALFTAGQPIDILTVTEKLKDSNHLEEVGGPLFITQLSGKGVIGSHTKSHCRIVLQRWMQREVIRISQESQKKSYDGQLDVNDIVSDMIRGVTDTLNVVIGDTTRHVGEVTMENVELIEKIMSGEKSLKGIPTGINELDEICNGLQKSDFVVIAARPSIGKTALMISMAYNISVVKEYTSVIFSLEMSTEQLDLRLKIGGSEIDSMKVYNGYINSVEFQRIRDVSDDIMNSKLFIDDTPGLSIMDIRARLQRLMLEQVIDVVFIDYIQLMKGTGKRGGNREQEVSMISQGLKNMGKEFNIPVIALAQLNRSVETFADQRPKLSTLRESGSLEQDADQVWLIYRASKAGIMQDEQGNPTYDRAEIIIAKHRNGATGSAHVGFHEKIMKFMGTEKLKDTQLDITYSDLHGDEPPEKDNPFERKS